MKVFATYQAATGDELELSSGKTETGNQRVKLKATLPSLDNGRAGALQGATLYLSKAQALDLADAMKRAALELP